MSAMPTKAKARLTSQLYLAIVRRMIDHQFDLNTVLVTDRGYHRLDEHAKLINLELKFVKA